MYSMDKLPIEILKEVTSHMNDLDLAVFKRVCPRTNSVVPMQNIKTVDVCRQAIDYGRISLIEWALAAGYPRQADTAYLAAAAGNLELLEWALNAGYPRNISPNYTGLYNIWEIAAENGHTHIMDLLTQYSDAPDGLPPIKCKLSAVKWLQKYVKELIVGYNHNYDLETLQWLHVQKISINDVNVEECAGGSVEMCEWLASAGYLQYNERFIRLAAAKFNWDVVELCIERGISVCDKVAYYAIKSGDIDIAEYYVSICVDTIKTPIVAAVQSGNAEVVDWAIKTFPDEIEHVNTWMMPAIISATNLKTTEILGKMLDLSKLANYTPDSDALYTAASRQLCMLDKLFDAGFPVPEILSGSKIIFVLASTRELDWLISKGSKFDIYQTELLDIAALMNDLPLIKWLHARGYTKSNIIIPAAVSVNNMEMINWAFSAGYTCVDTNWHVVASHGRFEMLKRLHIMGMQITSDYIDYFASNGDVMVLEWIYSNTALCDPVVYDKAIRVAVCNNHINVIEWMFKKGIIRADQYTSLDRSAVNL